MLRQKEEAGLQLIREERAGTCSRTFSLKNKASTSSKIISSQTHSSPKSNKLVSSLAVNKSSVPKILPTQRPSVLWPQSLDSCKLHFLARLTYASPAWWRLIGSEGMVRLQSVVSRAIKQDFLPPNQPAFDITFHAMNKEEFSCLTTYK